MKKLFLFVIIITQTMSSNAQFKISDFPGTLRRTVAVEFLNNKVLLGTSSNTTYLSDNGGKSFKLINFPISNFQILNDSTLICYSRNNSIISFDNGKTQSKKTYLNNLGDSIKIDDIGDFFIFKNGKGFITSYTYQKPKVFLTTNWGNSWNELDSNKTKFSNLPIGLFYSRKKCTFEKSVYKMRGSSDTILYKYLNYGDSIIEINLPQLGITNIIWDIAFKDENNGILLSKDHELYITKDGCKSFTNFSILKNVLSSNIEYANPTKNKEGFYIASLAAGGSIFSKDDGKTWNKNIDSSILNSLDFYDAETGIVTIGLDVDFNTNIFYFTGNTTNISETKNIENNISVYPNPVNNTLNYSGLKGNVSFKIFNIQGQLLLNGTCLTSQINVSILPFGLYILNVETEQGKQVTKFIKNE